ncbi:N-acetylmuramoyl-L-alanine amidase [Brevibacillus fluminis]|uniref:N-acetylmuramoyl-L-alanine amidase n=1 Tax=Brevibacillus fluminis TaxID=511487 RepID=UPI003F8CAC6B
MRKSYAAWMLLLFSFCLLPGLAMAAPAQAQDQLKLMVEGKNVDADVPPILDQGRTLVPVRVVAEQLGATVTWDDGSRSATIVRGQTTLELTLDRKTARKNGKDVQLDTAPKVHNGRMLLPLRFVSESLGLTVGWEDATRTVIVNSPQTVSVNGSGLAAASPVYVIDGTAFVPVDALANSFGLKDWVNKQTIRQTRTIDSVRVAPLDEMRDLLGADTQWDQQNSRITFTRDTKFTGVEVDGEKVTIKTTNRVIPASFTLEGPHRIVMDFPQTHLSGKMQDGLDSSYQGIAYQASAANDSADRETTQNNRVNDQSEMPSWLSGIESDNESEDVAADALNQVTAAEAPVASDPKPPLVTTIRYSQYQPDVVRVVVELSQKSNYDLSQQEDGVSVTLKPAPRKTGYLIVIDAGHGGHDNGASGVAGNKEKDYNLAVANKVVKLLSQYKEFQVVATRSTDVYLTLQQRVEIANNMGADLFLSVHANSFTPASRGTETFYYNANSEAFARLVHSYLVKATGFPDRTVQIQPFYVIKNTKMPATLTETGFLTNEIENKQLMSPAFQDKIAQALATAIREYYLQHQ